MSYNQWTTVPERTAAALPARAWSAAEKTIGRDGTEGTEPQANLRHTTEGSDFTFTLAAGRWKQEGEMFWRYGFVAHAGRRTDAGAVLARHRLQGG